MKFLYRENRNIRDQLSKGITTISKENCEIIFLKNNRSLAMMKKIFIILYEILDSYASKDTEQLPTTITIGINISGLSYLDKAQRILLQNQQIHLAYNLTECGLKNVRIFSITDIFIDGTRNPYYEYAVKCYTTSDSLLLFEFPSQ